MAKFVSGSDWVGRRDSDPTPILYISTSGQVDKRTTKPGQLLKRCGAAYFCVSYAYLCDEKVEDLRELCKYKVLLDSGAHSFHMLAARGKAGGKFFDRDLVKKLHKTDRVKYMKTLMEDFAKKYAKFITKCDRNNVKFDSYITTDFVQSCPDIYARTAHLQELGCRPIPVYHGDASLDWVRKYIDEGHKLLCVGTSRVGKRGRDNIRRYYSTIFELTEKAGVACHGLAITGDLMFEFPWYSVDSTSWMKAAAYGHIVRLDPDLKQRLALVHISNSNAPTVSYGTIDAMSPKVIQAIKEEVEEKGFDFKLLRSSLNERALYNTKVFMDAIEKHTQMIKGTRWKSWKNVL